MKSNVSWIDRLGNQVATRAARADGSLQLPANDSPDIHPRVMPG